VRSCGEVGDIYIDGRWKGNGHSCCTKVSPVPLVLGVELSDSGSDSDRLTVSHPLTAHAEMVVVCAVKGISDPESGKFWLAVCFVWEGQCILLSSSPAHEFFNSSPFPSL
jgi:hypothetical protein